MYLYLYIHIYILYTAMNDVMVYPREISIIIRDEARRVDLAPPWCIYIYIYIYILRMLACQYKVSLWLYCPDEKRDVTFFNRIGRDFANDAARSTFMLDIWGARIDLVVVFHDLERLHQQAMVKTRQDPWYRRASSSIIVFSCDDLMVRGCRIHWSRVMQRMS